MKDLVKNVIVLQIQTAPSRLQPASARCFPAAMITKCSIRESCACATRYIVSTGRLGISKHRSSVETATQNMQLLPEGRYIAMRNNTHFI